MTAARRRISSPLFGTLTDLPQARRPFVTLGPSGDGPAGPVRDRRRSLLRPACHASIE
jgi:hypothetical protein